MGYDAFSAKSLATINVLCVPAGQCDSVKFDALVRYLSQNAAIVPRTIVNSEVSRGESNSGVVKDGALLFEFSGHLHHEVVSGSFHFEPDRHVGLVLGLLDESVLREHDGELESVLARLQHALHDTCSNHAIEGAHSKIVVFGSDLTGSSADVLSVNSLTERSPNSVTQWLVESASAVLNHSLERIRIQDVELPQWKDRPQTAGHVEVRQEPRTEDVRRQSLLPSLVRSPTQTPPFPDTGAHSIESGKTVAAALIKLQLGLWLEALEQFADGARAARESNSPA